MADTVTMTLGPYSFDPVPLVNLKRSVVQPENKYNQVGHLFTMELNGFLAPIGSGGLPVLLDQMSGLRYAASLDGQKFSIKCNDDTLMEFRPEIKDLTFQESNNNWVQTIPYTLVLEYQDSADNRNGNIAKIESYEETWDVEFLNEGKRHYIWDLSTIPTGNRDVASSDYPNVETNNPFEAKVTHTITCVGKRSWVGAGDNGVVTYAADNAMEFITTTAVGSDLGYMDNAASGQLYGHAIVNFFNLSNMPEDFIAYDNFRSSNVNETNGTATVVETFYVIGTNSGLSNEAQRKITEDFTVDIRESIDTGLVNVSVQGQIQGLEYHDYSTTGVKETTVERAYDNAASGWVPIQRRIYPRAQFVYLQDYGSRNLNPQPLNKSVSHAPNKGIISYNLEYNDRPCSFIAGSLSENITIVDNNPTDVFASLAVLGRNQGPVLQSISTITGSTREITVEAVMPPPTACATIADLNANIPSGEVQSLLCLFETELTDANNQVFKNSDNVSWNPIQGRYSRTVGWTYQDCSVSGNTSMCQD